MNSSIDTRPPQDDLSSSNGNGPSHAPASPEAFSQHRGKDVIPAGGVHDFDDVEDEGITAPEDLLDDVAGTEEGSYADRDESAQSLHTARPSAPSVDVVHEALKGPEVGFKFEVASLEKQARQLAQESADRGLPRHDLERGEPIQEEVILAQRASEIYTGWIRRVGHKVDTAISAQMQLLNEALENGWRVLESYRNAENTLHRLAPRERASKPLATNASQTEKPSGETQGLESRAQGVDLLRGLSQRRP